MKKYETLIFDLDNTLIDNNQSIKYAFTEILKKLKIDYNDDLLKEWNDFDKNWWHEFESGKSFIPQNIKPEDKIAYLKAKRFMLFFKDLNLSFEDAVDIDKLYCYMLGNYAIEIAGANQLLKNIYLNYEIVIATNGPKDQAINKIEKANLSPYISSIISVEDTGYPKPMKEFFEFLYTKVHNKDKNKMLLIGDSLSIDIQGGGENGIDTCWFNQYNLVLPENYHPNIIINDLLELIDKI